MLAPKTPQHDPNLAPKPKSKWFKSRCETILCTEMFPASVYHTHRQEHFCRYVLAYKIEVINEKPPNMTLTWLPKRSQKHLKTNAKIN